MPPRDLMVKLQRAADSRTEAQGPLPSEAAGHKVVVGDIPRQPPGFQPRPHLIRQLNRPGRGVSVLMGPEGIGKTQLAAAYARAKLAGNWRLVAWVNAGNSGSLLAGLAAVADAAGLSDDSEPDPADVGVAVRRWLEADGDRRLLVFDDAEDPDALRPLVPAGGASRVLITSTRQSAANLGTCVAMDAFSADEALAVLVARAGSDDEAGAAAVAAALGHLPLPLTLAAPVIRGQRHRYATYLERLQTTPAEAAPTGEDGQPYPRGVGRAVQLSLAAIGEVDKTGICPQIMAITAVLSAAGVRRELLYVAGRVGGLVSGGRRASRAMVDRALEWLNDRSLLTFGLDGQTVIMHRLVAQVVRDGLDRRRQLGAVCWVAASVLEAYATAVAGSPDRPAMRSIPQQVTALLSNTAELAEEADEELTEILLRLRLISLYRLIELGDSAPQAIAVGEPLTMDLERLRGSDHPDTLNARNGLAAAYLAVGRVDDAIPLFEQTLVVLQRQLGPDHPDSPTAEDNLAPADQAVRPAAGAIQRYELNLAERERLLGADHPGTLSSRGNLAAAYLAAGRAAETIPLLEQIVAARTRVLPPDHPHVQNSQKNLATAYVDEDGAAEASPSAEQASAAGQSQAPADAAAEGFPGDFRRPPTDPARSAIPAASFRRPPADPAGRLLPYRIAGPPAKLPDHSEPRAEVLSSRSPAAGDAVTYRPAEDAATYSRRVVRRAQSKWFARYSRAIRWVSWDSIRTHPETAIAAAAVALWAVAAVSVTLLTFAR